MLHLTGCENKNLKTGIFRGVSWGSRNPWFAVGANHKSSGITILGFINQ